MLNLVDTNDKLQLVTSAAANVDVVASLVDLSGSTVTPGKQLTNINTAATTDIVAAPGASTYRNVKSITIRNKHASTPTDVTVVLDDNGTDYELHKTTLRAGECLEFIEGVGFFKIETITPNFRTAKLGSDQSNSTTTPTEVTGLSLTTGLGTFVFEYFLLMQSAATTTGYVFNVNHTGTLSSIVWNEMWVSALNTAGDDVADQDVIVAGGGLVTAFASRTKGTGTGRGTITDVDTANADVLIRIQGLMIVTADGDIEVWHASDAAAASTVKAGSSLILTRTGD